MRCDMGELAREHACCMSVLLGGGGFFIYGGCMAVWAW
jgi:hypothetical protein